MHEKYTNVPLAQNWLVCFLVKNFLEYWITTFHIIFPVSPYYILQSHVILIFNSFWNIFVVLHKSQSKFFCSFKGFTLQRTTRTLCGLRPLDPKCMLGPLVQKCTDIPKPSFYIMWQHDHIICSTFPKPISKYICFGASKIFPNFRLALVIMFILFGVYVVSVVIIVFVRCVTSVVWCRQCTVCVWYLYVYCVCDICVCTMCVWYLSVYCVCVISVCLLCVCDICMCTYCLCVYIFMCTVCLLYLYVYCLCDICGMKQAQRINNKFLTFQPLHSLWISFYCFLLS